MDLVNKEDIMRLHLGERADQIRCLCEGWSTRHIRPRAHFCGNHMSQCCLSEPRWPVQQHMLHRFTASLCGLDRNTNPFNEISLTDVFIDANRAQCTRRLFGIRGLFCCRNDAFACHANKDRQN